MIDSHAHRRPRAPARLGWRPVVLVAALLPLLGCLRHTVDVKPTQHTVTIEPIYMTVDINIRVQRELDQFYDDVVSGAEAKRQQGGEL